MAIITLNEYKTHAGITGDGDNARLQDVIDEATAALRKACYRDPNTGFEAATRTEDYTSSSGELQLREYPVSSITSITSILSDNTLGTAVDSSRYSLDTMLGIVTLNDAQQGRVIRDADADREVLSDWSWNPRWNRVRVVYVTPAPAADVKGAVKRMVDGLYSSIRRDTSIASQSLGGWSVSYASPEAAAAAQLGLLRHLRGGGVL